MESPRNLRSCVSWRNTRSAIANALRIARISRVRIARLLDQSKHDLLQRVALNLDPGDRRFQTVVAQKLRQELGIIFVCFRDCVFANGFPAASDVNPRTAAMQQVPRSIAGEQA